MAPLASHVLKIKGSPETREAMTDGVIASHCSGIQERIKRAVQLAIEMPFSARICRARSRMVVSSR